MKKLLTFLLSLCLILAFLPPLLNPVESQSTNWLSGWLYRKSIIISHSSGAGTNYQVKIIVKNSSNSDSGNIINIDANPSFPYKVRSDFGDIRFTGSDGQTLVYAWNETFYSGLNMTLWLKITDDLSSVDQTIYIYYGNKDATPYWDGSNTFLFFDDFVGTTLNSTKWTTWGYGTNVAIQNSVFNMTGTINYEWRQGFVSSLQGITYGRWESNCSIPSGSNMYTMSGLADGYDPNGNWRMNHFYVSTTNPSEFSRNGLTQHSGGGLFTSNAFSIKQITWNSTVVQFLDNQTTSVYNETVAVPTTMMNASMIVYATNGVYWSDWIFLSKFVYPEPTRSSSGSEETIAPQFDLSKGGTNSTSSVSTWNFFLFWYVLQGSLSGFIFSVNVTSTYVNDTWTPFAQSNNSWSNKTLTISLRSGNNYRMASFHK